MARPQNTNPHKCPTFSVTEKDRLPDLSVVSVDTKKAVDERIKAYLTAVENPYYLRCLDIPVHICFSGSSTLTEILTKYFADLKNQ